MVTYAEILVLAIRQIESQLEHLKNLCNGNEELYKQVSCDLYKKWNILTDLYRIETGIEYEV